MFGGIIVVASNHDAFGAGLLLTSTKRRAVVFTTELNCIDVTLNGTGS